MEVALIIIFLSIVSFIAFFNYDGEYKSGGIVNKCYKDCIVYKSLSSSVKNGWDVVADGEELHLIHKDFTMTIKLRADMYYLQVGDLLSGTFVAILKQKAYDLKNKEWDTSTVWVEVATYPDTNRDVIKDIALIDIIGKVLSEENPVYKEMLDKKRNNVYIQKLNIIKMIGGDAEASTRI